MGNSKSSSQYPYSHGNNSNPNQLKKKEAKEEESAKSVAGTPLKIGAAVIGAFWPSALTPTSSNDACTGLYGHQGNDHDHYGSKLIKIMSYNVWSCEDVQLIKRMEAIGQLIQQHKPDVIFFQEVTPNIYEIFQSSQWWSSYNCSVPPKKANRGYFCMLLSKFPVKSFKNRSFNNTKMGRGICEGNLNFGSNSIVVATSHLKSPAPPEMNSAERISQLKEAISNLNYLPNVVFGGDLNWDETYDGPLPLHSAWVDPWKKLRPAEKGWTYDTKANQSLNGHRPLQKRLDRFLCKLRDFDMIAIQMIGMEAIPGISYSHRNKFYPVYPSDHFGLLLTIYEKSIEGAKGVAI
ncbi:hypothetical protein AXF42_Ash001982 [Apostasia shenzhenica]|uniref:Endonuclease/exonuclease/phosphatase domain-containing protein n=1 Tax=Apostasia shenzhenica TaxID=1088818 RepID=A0A2I0ABS7_9ASPA|nr:hypothetical protein AXF42_Ash001982 [Apostasia shenzhenica]